MIDYLFSQFVPVGVFFLAAATLWILTAALARKSNDE